MFSAAFYAQEHRDAAPLDITDPALYYKGFRSYQFDSYYYHEKQILDILQQEIISEADYRRLWLLVHIPIFEDYCLAKDIWSPIAKITQYESFKTRQAEFKSLVTQRFEQIKKESLYIFETAKGKNIPLLQKDAEKLHQEIQLLLQERARNGCSFNQLDIEALKKQMLEKIRGYARQALSQTEQGQIDFNPELVTNIQAYEKYKEYEKILRSDIPLLIETLVKMRFYFDLEGKHPKLEHQLETTLIITNIRLNGFKILDIPDNRLTREQIQWVLNQLVFDELPPSFVKNNQQSLAEIGQLIQMGASPNALNAEQRTVLGQTLYLRQSEKALGLLSLQVDLSVTSYHPRDDSYLMVAIQAHMPIELIEELTKKTKNIDEKNNQGYRALDMAINQYPHPDTFRLIQVMIQKGASTKLCNDEGNTPLLQAAYSCNLEIISFLFQLAPDTLNEPNHQGETVLTLVLQREAHLDEALGIISFLIQKGANPMTRNKEGKNAFVLAEKNPQFKTLLEASIQKLANKSLTEEMMLGFISSFIPVLTKSCQPLTAMTRSFLNHYGEYLNALDTNAPVLRLKSLLVSQLDPLQKQRECSVRFSNRILQDILTGGEGHKHLLTIKPDIIDSFSRLKISPQSEQQKLPSTMHFGKSISETNLLFYGESHAILQAWKQTLQQQNQELGAEFNYFLSNPLVLSLPIETLKLMYQNLMAFQILIKNWGFSYEHFPKFTQQKIDVFIESSLLIPELKEKEVPISLLPDLSEERLTLVFKYRQGFYVLFKLGMSLDRFNTVKINPLKVWLVHPEIISFLSQHHLSLLQIMDVDPPKLIFLSKHMEVLDSLAGEGEALDEMVKLSVEELAVLLKKDFVDSKVLVGLGN